MNQQDDLGLGKRHHFRRSQSPLEREFESRGGGLSSRNRSPGLRYKERERERDGGYGDRAQGGRGGSRNDDRPSDRGDRDRDAGRSRNGDQRQVARRDEGYGTRERETERQKERASYDQDVKVEDGEALPEPEKPNFGSSGLLAKETNTVKGVELKYNEPPEARKPLKNWRLYVFKGTEQLDLIHIYQQSAYLVGRDQIVTDIPIAHPSCSKQHAVIQFRQVTEKNEFGETATSVKPFIIDLESTNGTHVNDNEIPKTRYYELRNSDVIKFGTSSREYVLLHEDAT